MINPLNFTYLKRINTNLVIFIILVFICGLPFVVRAQKASFYLKPATGNYSVGATFFVDVFINAEGIPINAAQAIISFPPEKLKVLEISKRNSVFSLWVEEPVFSNSQGKISFLGGLPNPGFIGETGKVITILFQAKASGEAKVSFGGEKILANDPKGTDIFSSSQGGTYSIFAPEEILPPEKPLPELPGIDTTPPHPFEIILDNEGDPTNPVPLLYFETKDDQSGMSHYEIKIDDQDFFRVEKGKTTPFRMPLQPPGIHRVSVKAIDKAGNFIESSTEVRIESIPIPQITICPEVFRSGEEMLYVGGTALPNSKVIVSLEKDGELIKSWEIVSDEEGDWSLAKEGLFKSGIYKILARAKDSRGAISNPSQVCFVKVVLGGISIGPWIISYKTLTSITIIPFFVLLLGVLYLFWRTRRTRKIIERETLDLKKKFYKEYNELRIGIEKELEVLRGTQTKRELTREEKKRQEELLEDLADVERVLRIELKDIEEMI